MIMDGNGRWALSRGLPRLAGHKAGTENLRRVIRSTVEFGVKYLLGGIGHALVSSVEEALFFHSIARTAQYEIEIKGDRPFTENYSVVGPEVLTGPMGETLGTHNQKFIEQLQQYERLIIAGQAKSHCVAWTIADLLSDIQAVDAELAKKVYLLDDCTSPIVIPGVVDHTLAANEAFNRFADAGMHIIRSDQLIASL